MSEDQSLMEVGDRSVVMARPPELVLSEAKKAADALQTVIKGKKDPVIFNGQQYVEFEDWQVLGKFYGLTAKVTSTTPVEFGEVRGFEARAVVVNLQTGMEISAADAMCLNDEDKWSARPKYSYKDVLDEKGNKIWVNDPKAKNGKGYYKFEKIMEGYIPVPMFQLRSMAQTRACAKALRNVLAWVVVLAGYKPTPAEEMDSLIHASGQRQEQKNTFMPEKKSEAATTTQPPAPAGANATPRESLRPMESKFPGKCQDCGKPFEAKAMIFYNGEKKKAYCHPECEYVPE